MSVDGASEDIDESPRSNHLSYSATAPRAPFPSDDTPVEPALSASSVPRAGPSAVSGPHTDVLPSPRLEEIPTVLTQSIGPAPSSSMAAYASLVSKSKSDKQSTGSKRDRFEGMVLVGWEGLKLALKIVKEASDTVPSLKAAVGALLTVIEHIEVRHFQISKYRRNIQNCCVQKINDAQTDLSEIAEKVKTLAVIFESYQSRPAGLPPKVQGHLHAMSQSVIA